MTARQDALAREMDAENYQTLSPLLQAAVNMHIKLEDQPLTALQSAAKSTHGDWEKAKASRDMYARLAALAANGDRTGEAKKYARSMLASEAEMNRIAGTLAQYPDSGTT